MPRPTNEPDRTTYAGRLAARMRERRLALKMSAGDAAVKAGVPEQTWYNWERGRFQPPISALPRIARAMGWRVRTVLPAE